VLEQEVGARLRERGFSRAGRAGDENAAALLDDAVLEGPAVLIVL